MVTEGFANFHCQVFWYLANTAVREQTASAIFKHLQFHIWIYPLFVINQVTWYIICFKQPAHLEKEKVSIFVLT
jgi:hypothetical protein